MTKKPKISVLTPIYNTNPYDLRKMMESILNQTFSDFEFIILNDSPENKEIENIVLSYKDSRIIYLSNNKNIGITKSRNKLIKLARGEYIAIADHDDISMPTRLEQESDFLDKNPHVGAVGGQVIEIINGKEKKSQKRPINDNDIKLSLVNEPYVCNPIHSGCMIRKSVLEKNNIKYNENWTPCEDRILFLDMLPHTCFHNLDCVVLKYVWTGNNTTLRQWQKMYDLPPMIVVNARTKFPIYYDEWKILNNKSKNKNTIIKLKLFGFLPLLTIKEKHEQKKVYLFNFIQLYRIKKIQG